MTSAPLIANFSFLMVSNFLSPLFSMILVLAISRLRGVEMLGKYSLIMTVFVIGQACATVGLSVIVTREIARARGRAGDYFVNACGLTGTLMVLAVGVLAPAMWWAFDEPDMRTAMVLTVVSLLPSVVMAHGEAVLLAFERARDYVMVGVAENAARAAVGAVLVVWGFEVGSLAIALLVLRTIAAIVMLRVLTWRGVPLRGSLDFGVWRTLLVEVPVVGSIPIVNQIYARSDVLLLTYLGTWREVGLYTAGLRLVELARTVPAAYGKVLYPVLSRLRSGAEQEFVDTARRSLRRALLLVAPTTLVLAGLSGVLVTRIFGADASGGEASLAVLAWTLVPLAIACVLAQVLFAAGKQALDLRVNVIATALSITLNVILIPWLGALGAALAMLVSMTVYAGLEYHWVRAHVMPPDALGNVARVVAVCAVSVVVVTLALPSGLLVALAAGCAGYAVGSLLVGMVVREDVDRARSLMSSVGSAWLPGAR